MNKEIMKYQSRKIIKVLPSFNHFFINGIYESKQNPPKIITKKFKGPYFDFCIKKYKNQNEIQYDGIDKSVDYLTEVVTKNKIDGIIAYSQGTYISSILSNFIDLKFIIHICGMKCKDNKIIYNTKVPSLHIIGKNDKFYLESIKFKNLYEDSSFIIHNGGHTFPKDEYIYQHIKKWIKSINEI